MKIAMTRVGVDAGCGGIQGPLFRDGSFEFIPIPQSPSLSVWTYGTLIGTHGKPLSDYFPPRRQSTIAWQGVHTDPEWATYTYGDHTGTAKAGLRHLDKDDILMFTCGLEGYDFVCEPGIYLIGYFVVDVAGRVSEFTMHEIRTLFKNNPHVRGWKAKRQLGTDLVLVKGSPKSRFLKKAVLLSTTVEDSKGRTLKVLSPIMRKIMGDFGGRISIQRSPVRWVDPRYVDLTAGFLKGLR